jgi:hypothetical protein
LENATKLVVGSFNPFNPFGNAPFYYGRDTNYFWKAIALNLGHDLFYYHHQNYGALRRFQCMEQFGFYFIDIIDSVEIKGVNNAHEVEFSNEKIFTNFSDSVLFTSNTHYNEGPITITRNYNSNLGLLLNEHEFETVIHTLGNNRIREDFITQPLGDFQNFIDEIEPVTHNFIPISYSPSQIVVNRNGGIHGQYFHYLSDWINVYLLGG